MFTMFLVLIAFIMQVVINDPLVQQIVTILMPVLVFVATWAVQKIKTIGGLPGIIIVALIMPLCSLAITLLTSWLNLTTLPFWQILVYGLLAVLISQIQIQWNSFKKEKSNNPQL